MSLDQLSLDERISQWDQLRHSGSSAITKVRALSGDLVRKARASTVTWSLDDPVANSTSTSTPETSGTTGPPPVQKALSPMSPRTRERQSSLRAELSDVFATIRQVVQRHPSVANLAESEGLQLAPIKLGLNWANVGSKRPAAGNELRNPKLADALVGKVLFTEEELKGFGLTNLRTTDFIKSGSSYFSPIWRPPPEAAASAPAGVEAEESFTEKLVRPPSRSFVRHLFYTLITIAIVSLVYIINELWSQHRQQSQVVESVEAELKKTRGLPPLMKKLSAFTFSAQGALVLANCFLVWRGLAIWNIIVKIKIIDTVQRLKWLDPATRHGASVLRPVTMPLRLLFKPYAMHRARVSREAQEMIARQAVASRPWAVASRWVEEGRGAAWAWLGQRKRDLVAVHVR